MKPWMILTVFLIATPVQAGNVEELLAQYRSQGAATFNAQSGRILWQQNFGKDAEGRERACTTCHGDDPRQAGRHHQTQKPIEPMAPTANRERFTDAAKVEKWFLRNCKGVLERECTPQEKGNLLEWLRTL